MKTDIKEITEKLEQGVKDVFESNRYKEYLAFMSKFYNYSVNNIILIMLQKPDASLIAGYKAWQTKFHRQVRKGEKGITILAPLPHKITVEDDNGDEKEISWMSFRPVKVFDVSQTEGDDIPTYIESLSGDVDGYEELVSRLLSVSPVPISFEEVRGTAHGYYNRAERRIGVQTGMSERHTVKTIIHEISHAILHDKEDGKEKGADGNTMEVQAESVAYTVCNMLGLDTSDYSFSYVAGWSDGKDVKELTASMEVIRNTAKEIITQIQAA